MNPNDDFIPMHYKVGDIAQLTVDGFTTPCECIESALHAAVFKTGKGGEYYYNFATTTITQLDDSNRCINCGRYICNCQTEHEDTMSDKVSLADVIGYSNEQQIGEVEGILRDLWEPNEPKNPKWGKKQNGFLVDEDGNECRVCFAADKVIQPMSMKGKRIRLKSKVGQRGATGVKFKHDEYEGKPQNKVWVTSTAIIEVIENGQPAKTTQPPAKTPPQSKGSTSAPPTAPKGQVGAHQPEASADQSDARLRVYLYFQVLSLVYKGYEAMKDSHGLPEIPDQGMREIGTHICMTFKGQYGVYNQPVLPAKQGDKPKEQPAAQSTESKPASDGKKAPPKASPPKAKGWADYVHPKRETTLGEIAEKDRPAFVSLLAWAMTFKGDTAAAKQLQVNLLAGGVELKITPQVVVETKLAEDFKPELIKPEAPDAYANENFGVEWEELTDDDFTKLLNDYDALLAAMTKLNDSGETEPQTGGDEIPE